MKTATLTALLLIGALAPRPAMADDLAVDLNLTQRVPARPVFALEAETLFGADLEGWLTWTVNGVKLEDTTAGRVSGRLFVIRSLPLPEISLVCAQFQGYLVLGGDLRRSVEEQSCTLFVPSNEPIRGPILVPGLGLQRQRLDPVPIELDEGRR